jgi:hypothetical protein
MMSADRTRRNDARGELHSDRDDTKIDRQAEEALRNLVRVLAREAARELFAKSCLTADRQT